MPQSSRITEVSPTDCLVSCTGHSLGESYSSAEMQSVYSMAPADWAISYQVQRLRIREDLGMTVMKGYSPLLWYSELEPYYQMQFSAILSWPLSRGDSLLYRSFSQCILSHTDEALLKKMSHQCRSLCWEDWECTYCITHKGVKHLQLKKRFN